MQTDKIEFNDIVEYIGPEPELNADLVVGNQYTVLEVKKDRLSIINMTCPFPIRCSVFPQWVKLVKKNPPPRVEKIMNKETTYICPCGGDMALTLVGDKYIGDCLKCGWHLEYDRKVAA